MNRRLFFSALAAAGLRAQQPAMEGPVLGYVLDGAGRVRPLLGMTGSPYAAAALEGAGGLRTMAGAYGLDAEGRLYYCQGLGTLRTVDAAGGGWTAVASVPRTAAAVASQGSRVVVLREGAAVGDFSIPFTPSALAIRPDGGEIIAADLTQCAAYGADGTARHQTALRGTRALHYGTAAWAVTSDLLRFTASGQVELIERRLDLGAPEFSSSTDGAHLVILDRGTRRLLWRPAEGESRELTLPEAATAVTPLRSAAAFLLTATTGWILDLAGDAPRFSQLPRVAAEGGKA